MIQLVSRGDTPEDRYQLAHDALEVAVDCYRRGMREPLPLFPKISYKLHKNKASQNDWQPWRGVGEGDDEANRLAFGDVSLVELRSIPAREDDPPGTSNARAERFANYFWDAVESSAEELS